MILSGLEIAKHVGGNIKIEPYDAKNLGPNSYNLRLHDELLVYTDRTLDMKRQNATEAMRIPADGMIFEPGRLYLARTVEYTETHGFIPMIEGRSSIGRLGMCIHVTAGFGDVGFCGYWTLEIFVLQPIRVYPFTPVCQVYYHTVSENHIPYSSNKYQGNAGIQASQLWRDFEEGKR
jgi:dCTP deaminase